uniref:Protein kinase domain-containing protein n=1 Tax=Heterorhabditis bacteriophora TaxID=37862 RepID=A0A1I7WSC3_HETBA
MSTSHEGDRKPDTQRVNSETSMHNVTVTPSKVISVPPEGVLPHDDDCIPSQVVNSSLKTISSHQDLLKFLDVHFASDGSCSYVTLNADLRPSLAITSRSNESLLFLEDRCELWSNYPLSSRRPTHSIQQSEDSFSDTFSCSVTSFRHRFSQFSIDNSCFDIGTCTAENSAVGTPIEKNFPGNDEICFVDNLKNSADGQQTSQVDELIYFQEKFICNKSKKRNIEAGKRYGDLRLIEMLRVRVVQLKDLRGSGKSVFVLAKLDNKDIHHSSAIARDSCIYPKNVFDLVTSLLLFLTHLFLLMIPPFQQFAAITND